MDMTPSSSTAPQIPPLPDLQRNMLNLALAQRSVHKLAMAFRLHKPRWGSQALLIAYGLSGYLNSRDWDVLNIEYSLPDYLDDHAAHPVPALRSLRLTQLRHLTELLSEAQPVTLRPDDTSERTVLLTQLANSGLLLSDLRQLALQDNAPEDYLRLVPLIASLTPESYVAAVHPDDRDQHPQRLHERITSYERRVQSVSHHYAQPLPGPPSKGLQA